MNNNTLTPKQEAFIEDQRKEYMLAQLDMKIDICLQDSRPKI